MNIKLILLPKVTTKRLQQFAYTLRTKLFHTPAADTFEMTTPCVRKKRMSIFNPFTALRANNDIEIDLKKKSVFTLYDDEVKKTGAVQYSYNPKNIGIVYKKEYDPVTNKIVKKPMEVNILTSTDGEWQTAYHMMSKDLKEEIGYVNIGDLSRQKTTNPKSFYDTDAKYLKDYPKLGIQGDRITVNFLKNWDERLYSGIGKLADQLEIEYCLKNGIRPCIISESEKGAEFAHFKRGKRFLPVDDNQKKFFMKKYSTANVNHIIKRLLRHIENKHLQLDAYPDNLMMYLPQKIIDKYLLEIKKHPILHD